MNKYIQGSTRKIRNLLENMEYLIFNMELGFLAPYKEIDCRQILQPPIFLPSILSLSLDHATVGILQI